MNVRVYVYSRAGRGSLYLGYRDPATGRKYSRSAGTTNRREAERAAALWEQEVRLHGSTDGSMPWDVFVTQYTERHLSQLRDSAVKAALGSLRAFEQHASPRTIGDVSSVMVADWLAAYRRTAAEQTVRSRLGGLKAALTWAVDVGILPAAPRIPRQRKSGRKSSGKGRAIEPHEFAAMLLATRGFADARQWRRNLRCLWLSGLRLGEAIALSWDDFATLHIDLSGQTPWLIVPGDSNKDGDDHLLPITPDWAQWLRRTPPELRTGKVLHWPKRKRRAAHSERQVMDFASKRISEIGKTAGVIVNASGKAASAHDLRRSFGARWSRLVMPQVLQLLMRHDDISTTMRYYVGSDTLHAAEVVATMGASQPPSREKH